MHLTFFLSQPFDLTAENIAADIQDLGQKLIAGFIVAVILAVAFTLIKQRRQEKRPAKKFISIKPE